MTADLLATTGAWIGLIGLVTNFVVFAITQLLKSTGLGAREAARIVPRQMDDPNSRRMVPFVSVHVPCCDEPPELVSGTLEHLARLDYPDFEVIVLDNNTPDTQTWQPIAALCEELGPRFRFLHVDRLAGAKAAALNLCLAQSDPRTRYIAIVDADYQVERLFLARAMEVLQQSSAAFVQFPQASRDIGGAEAVALELEDYFSVLARQLPDQRTPLLTGTLSVISIDALKQAGGWSAASVTEDAELGVRLYELGERGIFVDRVVGRGLLPTSLRGLKAQRRRWISGNVQTLAYALRSGALLRQPGARSVLAQLSAWPAFWLLPMLVLVLTAPLRDTTATIAGLHAMAAATILSASLFAIMRTIRDRNRSVSFARGVAGPLTVKLALIWVSSSAWFEPLFRHDIRFARTVKTPVMQGSSGINPLFSIMALAAAALYLEHGNGPAALASGLAALSWPAAIWVDRGLRRQGTAHRASDPVDSDRDLLPCTA